MFSTNRLAADGRKSVQNEQESGGGLLIVNADDWGQDATTTNRILDCVGRGSVTAVSAMVFMKDSERAATIALDRKIDAGLHLNFTTPFSASKIPSRLAEHLDKVAAFLRAHRLAQVMYHPGLTNAFEFLVASQIEEFRRLYGSKPLRLDGHHHMHLCANVRLQRLLPPSTLVRRSFSFRRGEKALLNRLYRKRVDALLSRRHRLTDYFFSLAPLSATDRIVQMFELARTSVVEVEVHPVVPDEYTFLHAPEFQRLTAGVRVGPHNTADLKKCVG